MTSLLRHVSVVALIAAVSACSAGSPPVTEPVANAPNQAPSGRVRHLDNAYAVLYDFGAPDEKDANGPDGSLVQDSSGNFYGTSEYSLVGEYGPATVFELTSNASGWTDKILHRFAPNTYGEPAGGLVIDSHGSLYGVSLAGPSEYSCSYFIQGCGFIFKLIHNASGWTETTLHTFTGGSDGSYPSGGLRLVSGVLYGVTKGGGGGSCQYNGCGTLYSIAVDGSGYKVRHSFSDKTEGYLPSGTLNEVSGKLFGVTNVGGPQNACNYDRGCGVIYSISPDGSGYTVVHYFKGLTLGDGATPQTGVVAYNGKLYGTTTSGGAGSCLPGGIYARGCGVIFTTNTSGSNYKVVYNFPGVANQGNLYPSNLVPDDNGNLYGTTVEGGDTSSQECSGSGCGTVFEFSSSSDGYTVLHKFTGPFVNQDGDMPFDPTTFTGAGLLLISGKLYGTTFYGGSGCPAQSCGILFKTDASDLPRNRALLDGLSISGGKLGFHKLLMH